MIAQRIRVALAAACVLTSATAALGGQPPQPSGKALKPLALEPLPLGSIKPAGWLEGQLQIQASGLSGHLDEFWPDIKESAWTGGKAEGWERAPYWLDGVVPLAYLLDDEALKAKVKKFIDYVLAHQHEDGWLGPVGDGKHPPYDPWPLYVLFKALTQYQEATGDARVIPALVKCAHKIDEVITKKPLFSWAYFRASDLELSLYWLYDRTGDAAILDLAQKVRTQAFDWAKLYSASYPFKDRVHGKFTLENHGVNTGMGLKFGAVRWRLTGDESDRKAPALMLELLDRHHGQATGIFTCDEHLGGRSPSQGTELCTVDEAMFSLEMILSILGEPSYADRLERLAYNAFPATFKPDMCAHQYDQQANQVVCKVANERVYGNNGPDANIFGLEPNFGCCTANMHQGWPKLVSHLWMKRPDGAGLAALAYAPCVLKTRLGKDQTPVKVSVATEYPFRETIECSVEASSPAQFAIDLRIPAWAEGAKVTVGDAKPESAKPGSFHRIERTWSGRTAIRLHFPMQPKLWPGYHKSVAIERGPLVYALRVGDEWKLLKGKPPFADWEVYPTTPWNYALALDREHPERSLKFEERALGKMPFSPVGAPMLAHVKGRKLPQWKLERNAAAPPPESPVMSEEPLEDLTLVPYGCTTLRVTEFPTLAP